MNIDENIHIVSAIRRLKLQNIAAWTDAAFEFCEGLNVITGMCGTGKRTIIKAILSALSGEPLLESIIREGEKGGIIEIEFANKRFKRTIEISNNEHPRSLTDGNLSIGEKIFRTLSYHLNNGREDQAFLFERVMEHLDVERTRKIFELMQRCKAQIIITTSRQNYEDRGKIFETVYDHKKMASTVKVIDIR